MCFILKAQSYFEICKTVGATCLKMLKNFPQADAEVEFVVMDYNSNTEDGDGDSSEILDP